MPGSSKHSHSKQVSAKPSPTKIDADDSSRPTELQEIRCALQFLENLPQEISGFKESIDMRIQNFEAWSKEVDKILRLKSCNEEIVTKVTFLEQQLNDLDAYGRRQNLEIHNIPIKHNKDAENLALQVLQKIDNSMKASDIDVAHRIAKETDVHGQKKRTRPIIVRFLSRKVRNEIYRKRRKIYTFRLLLRKILVLLRSSLLILMRTSPMSQSC